MLKHVGIDDVFEQAPVVLHCFPQILCRGRSFGIAHGDGVSDAVILDHRRVIHGKVGRALLKIPQGTKNGQKFRLREKGVLNSRTGGRGDQIVEVNLEAPVVHDERTKELLREYAMLHPEDPRAEIWTKV